MFAYLNDKILYFGSKSEACRISCKLDPLKFDHI